MREACDDLPCVHIRNGVWISYNRTIGVTQASGTVHYIAYICYDVTAASVENDQIVRWRQMLTGQTVDATCLPGYACADQCKRRGADDNKFADVYLEIAPGRAHEAVRAPTDPVLSAIRRPWR
jgi:hypothetical protein